MRFSSDIEIRPAAVEDIPAIARIGARFFDEAEWADVAEWDHDSICSTLRGMIADPNGIVLIAIREGVICGIAGGLVYPLYFNCNHIQGGGEFGVREYEDLTIGVDDESVTTAAAYNTVTMLSKTSVTPCDIEVYDMNDELVGILLNNQLDAWCLQIQITDKNLQVPTASYNWFSILYKPYAPTFVSDNDSLPDDVGHVLQRAVVAEILRKSTDEGERKRASEFASDSTTIASVTSKADGEGKLMPMDTAPSPFYSRFNGLV